MLGIEVKLDDTADFVNLVREGVIVGDTLVRENEDLPWAPAKQNSAYQAVWHAASGKMTAYEHVHKAKRLRTYAWMLGMGIAVTYFATGCAVPIELGSRMNFFLGQTVPFLLIAALLIKLLTLKAGELLRARIGLVFAVLYAGVLVNHGVGAYLGFRYQQQALNVIADTVQQRSEAFARPIDSQPTAANAVELPQVPALANQRDAGLTEQIVKINQEAFGQANRILNTYKADLNALEPSRWLEPSILISGVERTKYRARVLRYTSIQDVQIASLEKTAAKARQSVESLSIVFGQQKIAPMLAGIDKSNRMNAEHNKRLKEVAAQTQQEVLDLYDLMDRVDRHATVRGDTLVFETQDVLDRYNWHIARINALVERDNKLNQEAIDRQNEVAAALKNAAGVVNAPKIDPAKAQGTI